MVRFLSVTVVLLFLIISSCEKDPSGYYIDQPYPWETSTPEEQGLDSNILSGIFNQAINKPYIYSTLIIRNGFIVAEKYYNGFDANNAYHVMSVTKSFTSALIGIAIREGYINNLNQSVLDFFPEYVTPNMDPRKSSITIRHLLTMTAGFDYYENETVGIYESSNWVKSTIDLPLKNNPGERFNYNTPASHVLSAIITKVTGMSTFEFAQKFLFKPLNINIRNWMKDPQGYFIGGFGMSFMPRDLARFGFLYLNSGLLDNKQILPSDWVQQSIQIQIGVTSVWGVMNDIGYGFLWWSGKINNYSVFLALGYGGQIILIFPDLNIIYVATSDGKYSVDDADEHEREVIKLAADYILPAVMNSN